MLATEKGASGSEISPVLGTMYPGLFLASFLVPSLVSRSTPSSSSSSRFGLHRVFLAGILVASAAAVLFGLLEYVTHLRLFLALAYLVRFLEGVSMSVLWSTVLALLLAGHPARPAAVYALLDTTFGLGLSLGPVVGSLLFSLAGFLLPFLACGGAILATGLLSLRLVRPLAAAAEKQISSEQPSARPLLSSPPLLAALLATATVAFSAYGYMMSLLELHLSTLHLSPATIGLCFLAFSATYTVTTILCGLTSDSLLSPWTVCLAGLTSLLLSFLALGPVPYLPAPSTLPLKVLGLVLQGVGTGCVLVASYSCALAAALELGTFPRDVSTYSLVSSLWTAAYALGSFLGTSVAGALYDTLGWAWGCALVQVLVAATAGCTVVAACRSRSGEESKPLLQSAGREEGYTEVTGETGQPPPT